MTKNEIMQASLLDIVFEHRNKDYGAYALRKSYDTRLLTALGAGISVVAGLLFLGMPGGDKQKAVTILNNKEGIVIKEYKIPEVKPKLPEKPKEIVKQKAVAKTPQKAQVKFTSKIDIKKDELVKAPMATAVDIADKKIGDENIKGEPDDKKVELPAAPVTNTGTGTGPVTEPVKEFIAMERSAEFPGGADALQKFLAKNLRTPEDLDAGEKKVVRIRFKVDKDGSVNSFEIVTSGGEEFDEEVLRVAKKMPRWTPAFQNGINVPVNYLIPVTFIGVEY
jgi:periplasmic protein TonB